MYLRCCRFKEDVTLREKESQEEPSEGAQFVSKQEFQSLSYVPVKALTTAPSVLWQSCHVFGDVQVLIWFGANVSTIGIYGLRPRRLYQGMHVCL